MTANRKRARWLLFAIFAFVLTVFVLYPRISGDSRGSDSSSTALQSTNSGVFDVDAAGSGSNSITVVPTPAPEAIHASTVAAESAAAIAARAAANASP
jgi:hypothetical protein